MRYIRASITAGIFLALSAIVLACLGYLLAGHNALADWYLRLDPCFYKHGTWRTAFFTPGIKSDGNMYACFGIGICCAAAIARLKKKKSKPLPAQQACSIIYDSKDVLPVFLLLTSVAFLWQQGNSSASPSSDEVFSALNVAGIHPFQGLSYYMLPNNHLLFNLINNLISPPFADKVATGRVISLVACSILSVLLFRWLKNIVGHRWLGLLATLVLLLQFQVWGFSFQARGYELYLLAEWGMAISLFAFLQTGDSRQLFINAACSFIGFATMPSFLYFFLTQLLFMLLYGIRHRTQLWRFLVYQVAALSATYLFYLPALCFSGLEAIARNNYVAPMNAFRNTGSLPFVQWMIPCLGTYISHICADVQWHHYSIGPGLFFLPLVLLLFRKSTSAVRFGQFYICMWVVFLMVAITMKKLPFERNLIGHYSLSVAGIILVFWHVPGFLARLGRQAVVQWIMFPVCALWLGVHFLRTNRMFLKNTLYEYDVNAYYNEKMDWLRQIPAGSTVAVSEEDFYSFYILKNKGYRVQKCPDGNETFYVKEAFEDIPGSGGYTLFNKYYGNEIWKKQPAP